MSSLQAYRNGQWVDADALSIGVEDLGFVLGATVVERLRTFAGKPFRTAAHLARLRRSLEIVGWPADVICGEVEAAIAELVRRNLPWLEAGDDWSIAALVTPGATADARRPTLIVYARPLPFGNWADQFTRGVSAVLSSVRQTPENCWPPELKCRSRMHYYLADRDATARKPGSRAILLDQRGYVGEASTANVVAFTQHAGFIAPRLTQVLPGISQQVVFELAEKLGLPNREIDMTAEQLAAADEVMLTSTSICALPVVELDGRPIGGGQPGPVFSRLLAAWSELVGVDIAAQARQMAQRPAK